MSTTIRFSFEESLYPKDAIYGAAYVLIDRCWVHLDRAGDGRIEVTLRVKPGSSIDAEAAQGEFENEALGQAWRRLILEENRGLIESISTRAIAGAAGPPGLDDLLALEASEATAFEDPLGIAMSWEDKYKKKSPEAPEASSLGAASVEGEGG